MFSLYSQGNGFRQRNQIFVNNYVLIIITNNNKRVGFGNVLYLFFNNNAGLLLRKEKYQCIFMYINKNV